MAMSKRDFTIHKIKCHWSLYPSLRNGLKTAEFRRDDRGYSVGDILLVTPVDDDGSVLVGTPCYKEIAHKVDGGQFGIPDGFCMLSLIEPFKFYESLIAAVEVEVRKA